MYGALHTGRVRRGSHARLPTPVSTVVKYCIVYCVYSGLCGTGSHTARIPGVIPGSGSASPSAGSTPRAGRRGSAEAVVRDTVGRAAAAALSDCAVARNLTNKIKKGLLQAHQRRCDGDERAAHRAPGRVEASPPRSPPLGAQDGIT